jgi:hypothetical protein
MCVRDQLDQAAQARKKVRKNILPRLRQMLV